MFNNVISLDLLCYVLSRMKICNFEYDNSIFTVASTMKKAERANIFEYICIMDMGQDKALSWLNERPN